MNIGEKVCLYKERLNFKDYQEFGRVSGISGNWLLELSKKSDVSMIDINNLIKLCDYLNIEISQLVKNENVEINTSQVSEITHINKECDDIGVIFDEIPLILNQDMVRINGVLLGEKSKQICKDGLEVLKMLIWQHL